MFIKLSNGLQLIIVLAIILLMLGLGVTMEPMKILKFAKKPVGATIATLVQFLLMPVVAFGLGKLFKMDEIKMMTMIVLGCCPGGTLSNFMGKKCSYKLYLFNQIISPFAPRRHEPIDSDDLCIDCGRRWSHSDHDQGTALSTYFRSSCLRKT